MYGKVLRASPGTISSQTLRDFASFQKSVSNPLILDPTACGTCHSWPRQHYDGSAATTAGLAGGDQSLVEEAGAGRLFQRLGQRPIFIAIGAANRGDPLEMVFHLLAVALLELPKPVILPGADVVGVVLERELVPDLRLLVIAELAVGVADQVGDIGDVLMAERLQLCDRRRVVVAVVDGRMGGAISTAAKASATALIETFFMHLSPDSSFRRLPRAMAEQARQARSFLDP